MFLLSTTHLMPLATQLLCSSHLVDHTKHSIDLPSEFHWSKVFFGGQNMAFLEHPFIQLLECINTKDYPCPFFP